MDELGIGTTLVLFLLMIAADYLLFGFDSALSVLKPEEEEDVKEKGLKENVSFISMHSARYKGCFYICIIILQLCIGVLYTRFASCFHIAIQVLLFLGVLSIILIFGILIPRKAAALSPNKYVNSVSGLIRILMFITFPLVALYRLISRAILFLFGVRNMSANDDVTEQEIRSIVNEGHEQGVIQQTEAEMITNIFEFSDKQAKDIMTHRNNILAIAYDKTLHEAIGYMLSKGNSRYPVYEEDIDHIKGILHLRDAVKYRELHPESTHQPISEIAELLREPVFVPESKNIDGLFRQMQKAKTQIVVVIDEYGQTSGLVAMEDILEEIVGNIMDEYDVDENHISTTNNTNEFILDGKTRLEEIDERFGISFDEIPFETLNGFLISRMDRIPEYNDHFTTEYAGYRFRVLSVVDRKIQRVLMTRI